MSKDDKKRSKKEDEEESKDDEEESEKPKEEKGNTKFKKLMADKQLKALIEAIAKDEKKSVEAVFNEMKSDEEIINIPIDVQIYSKARAKGLVGGIRKIIVMTKDDEPIHVGAESADLDKLKINAIVEVDNQVGKIYGISDPRTRETYKNLKISAVTPVEEDTDAWKEGEKILDALKGLQPESLKVVKQKCVEEGKKGYEEIVAGTVTSVEEPSDKFKSYRLRITEVGFKGAFGVNLSEEAIKKFGIDKIEGVTYDKEKKTFDLSELENRPAKVYAWWQLTKEKKASGREFINGYPYYVWIQGMATGSFE